MRHHAYTIILAVAVSAPSLGICATRFTAPEARVGRNLQASTFLTLAEPVPEGGITVRLSSDDPKRLLLSRLPEQAGSASLVLTLQRGWRQTPEFWLQAVGEPGTATYTASSDGIDPLKAAVTIAPSAILILGPFKQPSFPTTPGGDKAKITVVSAALDSAMNAAEEQMIAGGLSFEVKISNSKPDSGKLSLDALTLAAGTSSASAWFKPSAEGKVVLAPIEPPGFSAPAQYATVTAAVDRPGLAVVTDIYLGKDLQENGVLCLGDPAPEGGLTVTLTSSDPKKLVLSDKSDKLGTKTLTLTIPKGELVGKYYMQSLADEGEVTYEATAPGFRSRTGKIMLAPSGFIVAYEPYGPPDEAAVMRQVGHEEKREFFVSLAAAKEKPVNMVVYSARLDPATRLAADFTVQSLRAGVAATVVLGSSDPAVGTVESPLHIGPGAAATRSQFIPLSTGITQITVNTPAGFTTPRNATTVPANVLQ
ncbi:MAG TPA: hypothetical protein VGF16_07585 [Bryobacteraceae bacterium]